MFLSENYLSFTRNIGSSSIEDYDVVTIDDLSLIPRKASVSDSSSNGIYSHDSGHDSYLEDGTGYSGDDEETVQCDICSGDATDEKNCDREKGRHKGKRNKRRRMHKDKQKSQPEQLTVWKSKELPKNDNFEFEGEKQVELKWTLECFIDSSLVPRLKRVVIDRGRPADLGIDNLMVFDESSQYCKSQTWRENVLWKLSERNSREIKNFNLLPTNLSCDMCVQQRQTGVSIALSQGKGLKLPNNFCPLIAGPVEASKDLNICDDLVWRKKILYDLKLNNCKSVSSMKSLKRQAGVRPQQKTTKRQKKVNHLLDSFEQQDWEVYDIISESD